MYSMLYTACGFIVLAAATKARSHSYFYTNAVHRCLCVYASATRFTVDSAGHQCQYRVLRMLRNIHSRFHLNTSQKTIFLDIHGSQILDIFDFNLPWIVRSGCQLILSLQTRWRMWLIFTCTIRSLKLCLKLLKIFKKNFIGNPPPPFDYHFVNYNIGHLL